LYRDRLSLRQVWVRIVALRQMPEFTPLDGVLDAEQEQAAERRERELNDEALAPFRKG